MNSSQFEVSCTKLISNFQTLPKYLNYGTAGFRDKYDLLGFDCVFAKVGIFACLLSRVSNSQCIGIVITASHNPECDNGIKIVDKDGGMLAQIWEPFAEKLANAKLLQDMYDVIDEIIIFSTTIFNTSLAIDDLIGSNALPAVVLIGRDTRPHSLLLSSHSVLGVNAMGGYSIDLGETTTPQIHFIVQQVNETIKQQSKLGCPVSLSIKSINVTDSINNYYNILASGYIALCETAFLEDNIINDMLSQPPTSKNSHIDSSIKNITSIVVDGSRGIGSISVFSLIECINKLSNKNTIALDLRNGAYSGPVNSQCGAEWVQKGQVLPVGIDCIQDSEKILCSFDGDADRIVFHSYLNNKFTLYDGDKIAALISLFISIEVKAAGINDMFSLGVVQTAYANGASTNFLKSNNIPFVMAKTGVKYLHHKALEFDIGIYFESNGHGTVLFSSKFLFHVSSWDIPDVPVTRIDIAKSRIIALTKVINQSVGDAVSDMLLVLAILHILKLDLKSWDLLYQDYPSKQTKIPSVNKFKITCTDDETSALTPIELQNALNIAMKSIPNGRCFVRPSGTEDVVRIYAEALTQDQANQLAIIATQAVIDHV